MSVRGVRGATSVAQDEPQEILSATKELLIALLEANPLLKPEDIASVIFTLTPDLSSIYPAQAARELGWTSVPLLCVQEIAVINSLPRCLRILIHWNTDIPQHAIQPVYLHDAVKLRPDLANREGNP
jgi:chorismate mutase